MMTRDGSTLSVRVAESTRMTHAATCAFVVRPYISHRTSTGTITLVSKALSAIAIPA